MKTCESVARQHRALSGNPGTRAGSHTPKHTQRERERRSVNSDVGSEREREHAQVAAAAAAAANSCHSTTAHAFDRGCNARDRERVTHAETERA